MFFSSCISSSIWSELFSKNWVWKFSRFSFGIGLSIIGGGSEGVIGSFAISVFGGIRSCMGRWSELKCIV